MTQKNDSNSTSGWRYQAVCTEKKNDMGGTYSNFSICEVYLDKYGRLEAWTENSSIAPSGETVDELKRDLQHMLDDAAKWKPVLFDSLQVGMVFERNCVEQTRR